MSWLTHDMTHRNCHQIEPTARDLRSLVDRKAIPADADVVVDLVVAYYAVMVADSDAVVVGFVEVVLEYHKQFQFAAVIDSADSDFELAGFCYAWGISFVQELVGLIDQTLRG